MGGRFFCAGVPRVPTPGCLSAGLGGGSCPLGFVGGRGWLLGCGGIGHRTDRAEDLPPSSWVSLSDEVSLHHSKAKAVWNWELAADPGGVEPVFWNGPTCYQRTKVSIGIY